MTTGFFDASSVPYDSQGLVSGSQQSCTVSSASSSHQETLDQFASVYRAETPISSDSAHQNGPVGHLQDFGNASPHFNTYLSESGFETLHAPTPRKPGVAYFKGLPSFLLTPVSTNENSPSSSEYGTPTIYGESKFLPQEESRIDTRYILPFAPTPKPGGLPGAIEYPPQESQVEMYDWLPLAPTPEPGGVVYNSETEGKL
ncbi:hypothetical protein DFH11DRAFT_1614388 [Phellopilus nigrolimitatus]|nr:hypothetical protein DFH11DRAFT_1614388 [Phellopilus nigrolimitatus]